MLVFVLLIGVSCMFAILWILYVLLGDHTDTLNKQTTKMQQMRNNSINVTLVLSKAWNIMSSNEIKTNLILQLSSRRAAFNRQQLCKQKRENKLLMVENKSNLFPGLRASRLKSNGINMLDINDSIGHVHHLC
ncbi:uncharacterized protein LOC111055650 isoform X2 [Nilaparvata lugens]|uniref:uncharacterized protein LOC111055650 isoform X2 n=2 Tax=Nilaparvata lugens TaxID=108931 RepID=UPI000B98ACD7|nr:uncharacterized protein LOC111055650 isoform X2 [Nilaparvata lugens]